MTGADAHPVPSAVAGSLGATTAVVVFDGVRVARGGGSVVEVPELSLFPGATALVGPNGSGKSTLLHLIAGLLRPVAGTVEVLGGPVAHAKRRVAYVLQSQATVPHLPVTAREVVSLARAAQRGPFRRLSTGDRRRVDEAMHRLGVADLADRQLSDMSGGQRQRVLVAQGIAQDADVLLLDEPIAGVDLASMVTIRDVIDAERTAGRAVVVATHDLGEASGYDQVVLMAGHPVASGSASDVLTGDNLRRAYAGRLLDIGGADLVVDDGAHHHDHDHHHDHHHHDHQGPEHGHRCQGDGSSTSRPGTTNW